MNKAKLSIQLYRLIFKDKLESQEIRMMLAKVLDTIKNNHIGWKL